VDVNGPVKGSMLSKLPRVGRRKAAFHWEEEWHWGPYKPGWSFRPSDAVQVAAPENCGATIERRGVGPANSAMMADVIHRNTLWALGIAVAAFILRLSLSQFPVGIHEDEFIIGKITQRFVENGILTADWSGFEPLWWSRPTYQFSPYTLLQQLIGGGLHQLIGWPGDLKGYILLARGMSCFWGALAVWLVYPLGRTCFSAGAALAGEVTLAICFLQVQDSIYARVDSLLCCLVVLSLTLMMHALGRPERILWFIAGSTCIGITVATKYNALPVLMFIPLVAFRWFRTAAVPGPRAWALAMLGLAIAALSFAAATPEVFWKPGPLLAGLRFEFNHYAAGQIPFRAHDWGDNNLFYWFNYLVWIGFGWLQLACAILFISRIKRWEEFILGTFLVVMILVVCSTPSRFERNLETCLGVLALVSGAAAWDLWCRLRMKTRPWLAVAASMWLAQPVLTLYRFHEAENPYKWQEQLNSITKPIPTLVRPAYEPPRPADLASYQQIIVADYGDPFSAEYLPQWKKAIGCQPIAILESPWAKYHYPFSHVDAFHGPQRLLVFQR
jgi:hypothetical protein